MLLRVLVVTAQTASGHPPPFPEIRAESLTFGVCPGPESNNQLRVWNRELEGSEEVDNVVLREQRRLPVVEEHLRANNHQPCEMEQIQGWNILDLACQRTAGGPLTTTFDIFSLQNQLLGLFAPDHHLRNLPGPVELLSSNAERFRGGLVCKAHRLLHHSTLGSRVVKKKRRKCCPWRTATRAGC